MSQTMEKIENYSLKGRRDERTRTAERSVTEDDLGTVVDGNLLYDEVRRFREKPGEVRTRSLVFCEKAIVDRWQIRDGGDGKDPGESVGYHIVGTTDMSDIRRKLRNIRQMACLPRRPIRRT